VQLAPSPPGAVTLGQAAWALMFVVLYIALATGAVLGLGLSGLVDFTLGTLLPVALGSITLAAILALYVHLVRRNSLRPAQLGFRRPTVRLFHLLWQIPATIITAALLQSLFLVALTLAGLDTSTAGAQDDSLADIAGMSPPFLLASVLVIAVLTPLWEEVLFRGAFLDGLSRRFHPALAIALSAALFAAVHLVFLTFVYLFALGVALAMLRRFHQNLWAPILLHAVNNGFVLLIVTTLV